MDAIQMSIVMVLFHLFVGTSLTLMKVLKSNLLLLLNKLLNQMTIARYVHLDSLE